MKVVCINKDYIFGDEDLYYKGQGKVSAVNFLNYNPNKGRLDRMVIDTLEIGKTYDVKRLSSDQFKSGYIINDFLYFNQTRFIPIELARDEKLKQLGI